MALMLIIYQKKVPYSKLLDWLPAGRIYINKNTEFDLRAAAGRA
jgi:hypothetical protein